MYAMIGKRCLDGLMRPSTVGGDRIYLVHRTTSSTAIAIRPDELDELLGDSNAKAIGLQATPAGVTTVTTYTLTFLNVPKDRSIMTMIERFRREYAHYLVDFHPIVEVTLI
jgi:hypothetical protein